MDRPSVSFLKLLAVFLLFAIIVKGDDCLEDQNGKHHHEKRKVCTVRPNKNGSDDALAVIKAFQDCGKNGRIEFLNETYHIESIMNTTGLDDVEIDLKGTLLVRSPLPPPFFICVIYLMFDIVGNKYQLLAQQLPSNGLPKPVYSMGVWRP
jgi:hypothetical protein